ncbi:hypothetical protein PTTG_28799 [Puccinia triticina 1-1 BBBD Race 1]|uniref:Uncharacterized protein n=2 Tax=Puccinia triticina TaxID=208348 RepID=A0A180G941_PUCT1|nr:uncharacterized protein PtA15_11A142 [Puccinia triticina]OAV89130.1 hypothetical protein PTTG_28799 [Puccinia triticina 1-1 BBBD Race 1]WAQ89454.1 hypothetical protein PtA15_11A142 [Puccinia triticina]WAR59511.1 hypothetical protein PtB15_11B151 [Puccinia triticina]
MLFLPILFIISTGVIPALSRPSLNVEQRTRSSLKTGQDLADSNGGCTLVHHAPSENAAVGHIETSEGATEKAGDSIPTDQLYRSAASGKVSQSPPEDVGHSSSEEESGLSSDDEAGSSSDEESSKEITDATNLLPRRSLGQNCLLLFVLPTAATLSFWMPVLNLVSKYKPFP